MPDIETIKEKLIKDPDFEAKIGQTKEETAEQEATQRVSQHRKNAAALAMATQPSNSVTDLNDYLKEKQKRREVDEMIYGPPTEEIREKMDRQLKVIDVDVNTLTVMRPPSNTSTQVKDELNQIIDKHYQSKAETENFELEVSKPAKLQDLNILKSFIKLAEELGLADDITKKKLESLKDDAATIILNMKYKFNRPRPVQLMDYHGVEFKPADFKTSDTPSYPSGHAFQGTLIAMVLSEIFPQHAEEFMKLGESIGDNRVVFGVHYPSDHYAGIELAKQVFPHVNFSSLDFKPIVEASPPESQPIEKALPPNAVYSSEEDPPKGTQIFYSDDRHKPYWIRSPKQVLFKNTIDALMKNPSKTINNLISSNNFEEINNLKNVKQRSDAHPEGDVLTHTKMTLNEAKKLLTKDPDTRDFSKEDKEIVMLAALTHDFGKPETTDSEGKAFGHDKAGVEPTFSFLNKITSNKEIISTVTSLVRDHLVPAQYYRQKDSIKESTLKKFYTNKVEQHGHRYIDLLTTLARADMLGRGYANDEAADWFKDKMGSISFNIEQEGDSQGWYGRTAASNPRTQQLGKAEDIFLSKLDATDITMIATGLAAAAIPLYSLLKLGVLPKISGDKKEEVEKVIEDKKEDLQKETVEIENGEIHNPTKEEVEDIVENIENKSASDITNEVTKTRKTRWDAGLNKADAAKIRAERKAKREAKATPLPKIGQGLRDIPEGAVALEDLNDDEFKEVVANLPKYDLRGQKLTDKQYEEWKKQKKEIEERAIQQDTERFGEEKGQETKNYFKDQEIKRDRRDRRKAAGLENWDRKEDDAETMPDWKKRIDEMSDEDLEKLNAEREKPSPPAGSIGFDDVSDEEFKEMTAKKPELTEEQQKIWEKNTKEREEREEKAKAESEKTESEKVEPEKVEPEKTESEKKKTPLPPIGEGLDTPKIEALIDQAEEIGLLDHIHEEIEGHGKENPFHKKEDTVNAIKAKYDTEAKLKEYLGKQHGKFQTFKTKQAETKQKEEAKQQKLEDKAKADADPNKKRWNVKDASPDEAYDSAKEMISHSLAHSEEHGGKGLDEKSVKHMNTQLAVARKLMGSKNIDKLNNELKNDEIKPAQLDDEKVKEDYEGSDIPPEARGYGASPEGVKIYTGPEGGQFYDKREAEKKTGDGTGETKTGEDGKVEKLPEPSIPKEDQVSTDEPVGDKASSWGDKIGSAVSALGRFAGKEGKEDRSKLISEASKYLKETADIMGPTFAGSLARNLARSRGYGEAQAQNAKLKNQLQAVARGVPIAGKIIPASEDYHREALAGLKGAQAEERAKQRAAEDKLTYGNKVDFEVKKSNMKNLQDFLKKRV
jgi:hypothetical protein